MRTLVKKSRTSTESKSSKTNWQQFSSSFFAKVKIFFKKHGYKALAIWIIWNILKFTVVIKLINVFFVK